jgi:hypothetical protein
MTVLAAESLKFYSWLNLFLVGQQVAIRYSAAAIAGEEQSV